MTHVTTRMMAIMLVAIGVSAVAAAPAAAQGGSKPAASGSPPSMDISAGYSAVREAGTGNQPASFYDQGWAVSFGRQLGWARMAVVGEAGGNYRLDAFGARQSLYGFLGGVRRPLVHLWRFSTFVQALVGVESFSQGLFKERGPAFQPGAGIDWPLRGALGLRVQGDFRIAHEEGINFKEGRFTASVVVGIR